MAYDDDSKGLLLVVNNASTIIRQGWLIGALAAAALLVSLALRLFPESTPVARGTTSANLHGCIECHGQPDISLPDDAALDCADVVVDNTNAHYEGRCGDLLAYFEVVRLKRTFRVRTKSPSQNLLLQGERLARQYNCFQCHGELGQGGFRNAGALKGYIPGYFGNDFALLTRGGSAESVRAWISQGIDPALLANPIEGTIAEFFIEQQRVSMPIFGTLPDAEIRILTNYVIALNQFGEMDAKAIRAYSRLTQRL